MIDRRRLLTFGLTAVLLCLSVAVVSASELQLAGIRLGRSALTVMHIYGNPSEIIVGATAQVQSTAPTYTAAPLPSSYPGSGFPTMPGMTPPPSGPVFGSPAVPTVATTSAPEVTWLYRFPKNKTLEFVISPDGRVTQIAAFGVEWPGVGTSRGVKLGMTYKDIILKYGFPEAHEKSGIQMVLRYSEKHGVLFTFVGKTLVGITIALMD